MRQPAPCLSSRKRPSSYFILLRHPSVAAAELAQWPPVLAGLVGADATFVVFLALGLAIQFLMSSVLTIDLYNEVLFLFLVPSTVRSSIAFTSIARGHVSASIMNASLSNILGVVVTPLLVVLLMNTSGVPRLDGASIRYVVLQLLLPFEACQLMRPGSLRPLFTMSPCSRWSTATPSCWWCTRLSRWAWLKESGSASIRSG
ncbi:hypothetical protein JK2ML_0029 [Mycobacterium leprae Kyoto-2]|uniref:Possible membrane protein n=3 Tax=Mycobacterium leprae TaxID=1769 RepID=Q9CDE0_MYCLE|nr:bile acid:sodium symporter family protein [Mycobacterium leprae]OAR19537.1 hypothetical protein A8144_04520 [Mycobacterium leprae 3125609]OAX71568.1 hypothetical protein A3216_05120 [Mycobacterium leprae 7935681]CAR70122.1 possible membrane protein [Mycobacterium leprae Br4923]BBC16315.1 hypothetical protein JK2ML_0029 [Mycobacterium leprae Kyoto-2]